MPQSSITARHASTRRRRLRVGNGPSIQTTKFRGPNSITQFETGNSAITVGLLRHPPLIVPPGTCYGRTDFPLAPGWEAGLGEQAEQLAMLAPQRLWSSPSGRCAAVAEFLAARLGIRPVWDPRLLELDFGEWEGRPWSMVPRAALDRWAADPFGFAPPGGESGATLIGRVTEFSRMLIGVSRSCIVVSHGGPLRLLPASLRGNTLDLMAPAPALGALEILRLGVR